MSRKFMEQQTKKDENSPILKSQLVIADKVNVEDGAADENNEQVEPATAWSSSSFQIPPLLSPPSIQCINSATGLVHCVVTTHKGPCRWGNPSPRKVTVLSLETSDGTEVPLLRAVRSKPWQFQIFLHDGDHRPIGGLRRISASLTSVVYHLYTFAMDGNSPHYGDSARSIAVLVYKVHLPTTTSTAWPTGTTNFQRRPPRFAELALPVNNSFEAIKRFETVCHESISKTGLLSDVTDRRKRVILLKSKAPYSCGNDKWGLNFKGRGRLASNRNMQMEYDGKIIVQMVKWSKQVFHVDFCQPLTLLHAFGFALAQFHL